MALPSTTVRRLTCQSHRQHLLQTFITSIGGPVLPRSHPFRSPHRSFTTTTPWREDKLPSTRSIEDDFPINEINNDLDPPPRAPPAPSSGTDPFSEPHIPWYLQSQPVLPTSPSPFSTRQALPELPDHPPPLLSPLLSHVSVELGMDDLTLLDLRTLDPPSALGANLLMVVGTARSEKHLHVSADRLCRWLRTTHGLSPFADGLLGRNELKLKLRRRAKRSRLLSAVGAKATADTEIDEGIRTGWVCVNVGKVEGGELPEREGRAEAEGREVIGFGTRVGGSSLVVQLMTEEKRGEIDLEKLWTAVLKKSVREREAVEAEGEHSGETGLVKATPPA